MAKKKKRVTDQRGITVKAKDLSTKVETPSNSARLDSSYKKYKDTGALAKTVKRVTLRSGSTISTKKVRVGKDITLTRWATTSPKRKKGGT